MQCRRILLTKFIVVIIVILLGSGCWSRRELDTLAIVAGIGIDLDGETGKIKLTAQIIKPGNIITQTEGSGEGRGESQAFLVAISTGYTVFDAVRNYLTQSNRKLYFPHNQIIVFGREAAQKGVRPILDFFLRGSEFRHKVLVLVADGKASDVLEAKMGLEKIPAMAIGRLVEAGAANSQASAVTVQEFLTRLMNKSSAPVAPRIEVLKEKVGNKVLLKGTAVFKDDKLVGQLDNKESRGLLWITGKVKNGVILVQCPGGSGKASLEIIRTRSRIIPELREGKVNIKVEISEEGNLSEQMCSTVLAIPATQASLERRQAAVIQNEVKAVLQKARELNVDIFGFGEAVHRKYPAEWKSLKLKWDEVFPNLEVAVTVRTKIRRVGSITKPAVPQ